MVGSTDGTLTLRLLNTDSIAFDGPLSVSLFAITNGTISSTDSSFETVSLKKVSIGANSSTTVVIHFQYPTSVPNGSYEIAAAVTATGTDTAAADAVSSDSVKIDAPVVDLSAKALHSSLVVDPGHRRLTRLRITNTGNFTASGQFMLDLYTSTDQTLDASDTLIASLAKHILLRPGHSMLVDLRFLAPSSLAAGSYYLIAAASSSTRPVDIDSADKDVIIATRV